MGLTERNFGEDKEARMYEQVRAVAMGDTRESWGLGDAAVAPVVVKIAQITGEKTSVQAAGAYAEPRVDGPPAGSLWRSRGTGMPCR